mgnify:CR=1 FL=1
MNKKTEDLLYEAQNVSASPETNYNLEWQILSRTNWNISPDIPINFV